MQTEAIEFSANLLPRPPRGEPCCCAVCSTAPPNPWYTNITAKTFQCHFAIPMMGLLSMMSLRHIGSIERSIVTRMLDADRRRWLFVTPYVDKMLEDLRTSSGDGVCGPAIGNPDEVLTVLVGRIVEINWLYLNAC